MAAHALRCIKVQPVDVDRKIKKTRNHPHFGNGDIDSPERFVDYKGKYGVDGVMIGRASSAIRGSLTRSSITCKPVKN